MAGETFDVYIDGCRDPTPAGMASLTTAIAARYKMPADQVQAAVAKGRFRVGKALERATADRLARQLEGLGALTLTNPSGKPLAGVHPTPVAPRPVEPSSPSIAVAAPVSLPSPAGSSAEEAASTPPPDTGSSYGEIKMPSSPSIQLGFIDGEEGGSSGPVGQFGGDPDVPGAPAAAPPKPSASKPGPATGAAASPPARPRRDPPPARPSMAAAKPPAFDPSMDDPPLELDLPKPATPGSGHGDKRPTGRATASKTPAPDVEDRPPTRTTAPKTPAPTDVANRLPSRTTAAKTPTPVVVDEPAEGNPNIVRCSQHRLMFDKTRTTGCPKCLEPPRSTASIAAKKPLLKLADLKHHAIKRAFIGLAAALLIGFLPTAVYVWGFNRPDVLKLRTDQVEIAKRPGTEEVMRAYDAVDQAIDRVRSRGAWKAFFLWTLLTGGAMAGFYKATNRYLV